MKKKGHFLFSNFKSWRKESGLTFIIFGLKAEILTIFAFKQSMSLEKNPFYGKSLFLEAGFIIFKVKNQHPSDIMRFLSETKS